MTDEVGYRKPPQSSRFKKGKSGNPKGRPSGTKNLKTDLAEELRERIMVREGNSAKRVTKQRAMVKTLMSKALRGDSRSTTILFNMMTRLLALDEVPDASVPLNEDESAVLALFEEKVLRNAAAKNAAPEAAAEQPHQPNSENGDASGKK